MRNFKGINMTTVTELKTKINGDWVTLLQDATNHSKGVVQVGDGLAVTDGVISISGGAKIDYTYTEGVTNGFKVGWQNYSTDPYVTSASAPAGAGLTLLFDHIKITKIRTLYPFINILSAPSFDTHFRITWTPGLQTYRTYSGKVVKDSDESILWSGTTSYTTEMSFPLDNWDFDNDTFSVYASGDTGYGSTVSINRVQTPFIIPYIESKLRTS